MKLSSLQVKPERKYRVGITDNEFPGELGMKTENFIGHDRRDDVCENLERMASIK